jgi:hypothetical protein
MLAISRRRLGKVGPTQHREWRPGFASPAPTPALAPKRGTAYASVAPDSSELCLYSAATAGKVTSRPRSSASAMFASRVGTQGLGPGPGSLAALRRREAPSGAVGSFDAR